MTEHEAFIRQCIALSEQAVRHGNEPFGALLVVDGDVRLTAQNQVLIESDPTRHAELLLASEAARRLDAAALERAAASGKPSLVNVIIRQDRAFKEGAIYV